MKRWKSSSGAVLLGIAALASLGGPARAADHRDAPIVQVDAAADINDVYAFVNPKNPQNVVLAMTVNPFTAPGVEAWFSPNVLYQFKIDNVGDYVEHLVIQATFTKAGRGQMVAVTGPVAPTRPYTGLVNLRYNPARVPSVAGPADGSILAGTNPNGVAQVFAGLRDDPFFFDLVYVERFLGILPGGPVSRAPGIDFFAGMNVSALVVEVPIAALKGRSGNTIHVWGTTSRARTTLRQPTGDDVETTYDVQEDRMGLPTINTVLIPKPHKDDFNHALPSQDRKLFRADAVASLVAINKDAAYSGTIADVLLPDVLTLDMTSTKGFLNGRQPADDVIDTVLTVASNGAVKADGVNANDKPFLADFPFLAPPHDPDETIPPRN
jgi:hypothetical protein